MDKKKAIADRLLRIRALWIELEKLEEGSPESHTLMEKIRLLSAEYLALDKSILKRR